MLGSVLKNETEFGRLMKQPYKIGGGETQSAYVVVTDADAVYTSHLVAVRVGDVVLTATRVILTSFGSDCRRQVGFIHAANAAKLRPKPIRQNRLPRTSGASPA